MAATCSSGFSALASCSSSHCGDRDKQDCYTEPLRKMFVISFINWRDRYNIKIMSDVITGILIRGTYTKTIFVNICGTM